MYCSRLNLASKVFQPDSLLQRLVLGLALAAVLFHAVGGCCCHHAHAGFFTPGFSTLDPGLSTLPQAACDCHRHVDKGTYQENHGEAGQPAAHRHGDGCDKGPCDFVVPESNGIIVCKPVLSLTAAIIHTDTIALPSLLVNRSFDSPSARSGPPLRLHLLNQILLL